MATSQIMDAVDRIIEDATFKRRRAHQEGRQDELLERQQGQNLQNLQLEGSLDIMGRASRQKDFTPESRGEAFQNQLNILRSPQGQIPEFTPQFREEPQEQLFPIDPDIPDDDLGILSQYRDQLEFTKPELLEFNKLIQERKLKRFKTEKEAQTRRATSTKQKKDPIKDELQSLRKAYRTMISQGASTEFPGLKDVLPTKDAAKQIKIINRLINKKTRDEKFTDKDWAEYKNLADVVEVMAGSKEKEGEDEYLNSLEIPEVDEEKSILQKIFGQ